MPIVKVNNFTVVLNNKTMTNLLFFQLLFIANALLPIKLEVIRIKSNLQTSTFLFTFECTYFLLANVSRRTSL